MANSCVVLLVSTDRDLKNEVEVAVAAEGWRLIFATYDQFGQQLVESLPDLVIFDAGSSGEAASQACSQVENAALDEPGHILWLLPPDQAAEAIKILDAGADDFLVLPLDPHILRARLYRMLRARQEYGDLQAQVSADRDLLGMLMHDLRSPLTAILGYTELLERGFVTQDGQPYIQKLHQQILRLEGSITDVHALNKMQSGVDILNPEPVDVAELVQQVQVELEPTAARKQIALVTQLPSPSEPRLLFSVDPALFGRVLVNLTANAVKVAPAGTTVALRLEYPGAGWDNSKSKPRLRLAVIDEGPRVADEHRNHLFDQIQVARLKREGIPRAGIDLIFCKLVVDAHNGHIVVEDPPSSGASFIIKID